MSQKSQKRKTISKNNYSRSGTLPSQPGTSQQTLIESFTNSQSSQINEDDFEELVKKCVRLFIYKAGTQLPVRKTELQKHILHNCRKSYDRIIEKTKLELKHVYGLDLVTHGKSSSTIYLVCNTSPYKDGLNIETCQTHQDHSEEVVPKDSNKILTLLVLAHLFMSGEAVHEASIVSFLNTLGIELESRHKLFGNVKEHIFVTMVKQKLLNADVDENTKKTSYSWGIRAEYEVSKRQILDFVCKMYKDKQPKSWTKQFEEAQTQHKEEMEVDEAQEIEDE